MTHANKNFQLAIEASEYVRNTVILGATNKTFPYKNASEHQSRDLALYKNRLLSSYLFQLTCGSLNLGSELFKAYWFGNAIASPFGILTTCLMTQHYKIGNCQEQATLAFNYLNSKGVSSLELCHFIGGDHAFVIIGREPNSDIRNPSTWGDEAVFCDPWAENFFAKDYQKWLEKIANPSNLIEKINIIQSNRYSKACFSPALFAESRAMYLVKSMLWASLQNTKNQSSASDLFIISVGLTCLIQSIIKTMQLNHVVKTDDEPYTSLIPGQKNSICLVLSRMK